MRTRFAALWLLFLFACSEPVTDGGASREISLGDAELAAGRLDAARRHYETARSLGPTEAWRVRAERQLVLLSKVESNAQDARVALEAISAELASAPSEEARLEFERLVTENDRDGSLRVIADQLQRDASARRDAQRAAETAIVDELLAGQQFAAAVLVVRELEVKRAGDDVADLNTLLERIGTASEAAAERCIMNLPSDPGRAAEALEEKLATLAGTPGAARVLAEREIRANSGPRRGR